MLRDHLLQGYTLNRARLRALGQAVRLITETARRWHLGADEARALLAIVGDYHRALALLDDYDHQRVSPPSDSGDAGQVRVSRKTIDISRFAALKAEN